MLNRLLESAAVRTRKKAEVENLLIVTAPRERLLLGVLALFVIFAGAWAVGGSVDRVVYFNGVVYRAEPEQPLRVALRVPPSLAPFVSAGMAARVEVALPDGTARELRGEVLALPTEPLPERIAERLPRPVDDARRIDIGLRIADESIPLDLEDRISRASISLGRQSILDLLAFRP